MVLLVREVPFAVPMGMREDVRGALGHGDRSFRCRMVPAYLSGMRKIYRRWRRPPCDRTTGPGARRPCGWIGARAGRGRPCG
ncbi:hypothetical protein B8V81_2452 [Paenibacillus pasadenensis]|uniref:Uncharacterized protein n=1 Tax=Paenibacillus pasadenensis TaxID=217090 RepID=A0A2N5N106_9BACL|nr:hypothetical protein B8V81_2452 [Paenibacillus pasadenensis]